MSWSGRDGKEAAEPVLSQSSKSVTGGKESGEDRERLADGQEKVLLRGRSAK